MGTGAPSLTGIPPSGICLMTVQAGLSLNSLATVVLCSGQILIYKRKGWSRMSSRPVWRLSGSLARRGYLGRRPGRGRMADM